MGKRRNKRSSVSSKSVKKGVLLKITQKILVNKYHICVEENKSHKYVDTKLRNPDEDINKHLFTFEDMHFQIKRLMSEGQNIDSIEEFFIVYTTVREKDESITRIFLD